MTQNEQNYINKINEMQNIIEWQKKAIAERDAKIVELESLYMCDGCDYEDGNIAYLNGIDCNLCSRCHTDKFKPKAQQ